MAAASGDAVPGEAPVGALVEGARAHFARWWPVLDLGS
jgi:hypothetical protein